MLHYSVGFANCCECKAAVLGERNVSTWCVSNGAGEGAWMESESVACQSVAADCQWRWMCSHLQVTHSCYYYTVRCWACSVTSQLSTENLYLFTYLLLMQMFCANSTQDH